MEASGARAAYRFAERKRNRRTIRAICVMGAIALIAYMVSAPFYLAGEQVRTLLAAIAFMLAAIAAYYFSIGSRFYLRLPWIDIPFFVAFYAGQLVMNSAFFNMAPLIGSSPPELIAYNSCVLLFAGAVAVVASPRSFTILAILIGLVCGGLVNHFGWPIQAQLGQLMPFFTALVLSVYANYTIDRGRRRTYELRSDLEKQKEKSENLLFNVLPREVALRLRGNETVADAFSEVSVIFIDIVGFSQMSRRLSPTHLVDVLNAFFSVAEECAVTAGVEKVKTIGDAFLAVAGATLRSDNCAVCAVNFAAQVIDCLASVTKSTGEDLQVRVGIHTGAVVGGVIGHSRKAYDYWGDTMNIASRIQNSAEPNSIFVSETTYHRARQKVAFGPAELKILKGVGETKVYRAFVGKVAP